MRNLMIAIGFAATSCLLTVATPAASQGFGQIPLTADPPPASAQAAKPPAHDVDSVTVTGKRVPESQRDPSEVLCHDELPIGSRFPKKICGTRRQFTERRMVDHEQLYEWTQGQPLKGN
jgi:hypothetical protein